MSLPPLPFSAGKIWPQNISSAHQTLLDISQNARSMIAAENFNIHRVKFHCAAIEKDAVPLLHAMEQEHEEGLYPWLQTAAIHFGQLLGDLMTSEDTARGG